VFTELQPQTSLHTTGGRRPGNSSERTSRPTPCVAAVAMSETLLENSVELTLGAAGGSAVSPASSSDDAASGPDAAESQLPGGGGGGGGVSVPPDRGARVLIGYFVIVLGFALFAASFPGQYETQFCGDGNRAACIGHLGASMATEDPGGQLLAVYVFYAGLLAAGVWGVALRLSPAFRSWAWRARPGLPVGGGVANAGQATLCAALTLLHLFWARWWWDHLGGCSAETPCTLPTKLAKTIGHLNDLDMSLLLLMASRANVWEGVLGLGFDAGVAWHRALGTLMVVFTVLHVLIWHVSWAAQGIWLEHAITYSDDPNVMLTNPNITCTFGQTITATCGNGHFWAIPSMEFFTLVFWGPAMYLALSTTSRRTAYERFYKFHHVFLGLIPLSYYHSWHVWQYSYIGVVLWAYNRYLAYSQSKLAVQVQKATALPGGVSHLSLSTSAASMSPHKAGQFMYINIPEIDPWQWHPFTVSSGEAVGEGGEAVSWQHHIKNMDANSDGGSTWTGQLHSRLNSTQPVTVRCHGPYGAPAFSLPADESSVVFYVGGIGCTPALSILATWAAAAASGARVPHATLVWAVRDMQLLHAFSSVLDTIARDPENFTVQLYCTQKGVEFDGLGEALVVNAGRPDAKALLDDASRKGGRGDRGTETLGVFACGPAKMVESVRDAAAERAKVGAQIRFHAETFEF
jgi:predicted ferric reductase